MSFREVVIKNFFYNIKQYLSFFLCNTFTIVVFFLYSTLVFHNDIVTTDNKEMFQLVLTSTIAGIMIFSIFFIIYAQSTFIKGRNKEFGIYISLGMNRMQLRKLVTIENTIISGASLAAGITVGALLSRLFQMAVISILEIDNVSFYLDYKSFLTTFCVVGIIFLLVCLRTRYKMKRMDIMGLLNEARKKEGKDYRKSDTVLLVIGIALLVASFIFELVLSNKETLKNSQWVMIAYVTMLFAAVYLLIAKGIRAMLYGVKRTGYYTKHMLGISQFEHKFKQNKRILFILSILSTLTIIFVAAPVSLLSLSESIAEKMPNNLEYVETNTINTAEAEEVDTIVEEKPITERYNMEFIYLSLEQGGQESIPVVSEKDYEALTGNQISLDGNECINSIVTWYPGNHGISEGAKLTLYGMNASYEIEVIQSLHEDGFVSNAYPTDSLIVVNEQEFERIYQENKQTLWGCYHIYQYENWKETKDIVTGLERLVGVDGYPVNATINQYEMLTQSYGTFLFLSIVLALLFFVAGGAVLYFRQVNELQESRLVYQKLFKIGITSKEMNKTITTGLRIIFFLPVVFGAVAGIGLIYYITNLFGGSDIIKEFMTTSIKVIIVYVLSQSLFYLLTKHKYRTELCL